MLRAASVLLVLVGLAGVVLLLRDQGGDGSRPEAAPPAAIAAPLPAAGVAIAEAAPVAAASTDRSRALALPDGTFVPALNGAIDPAPLGRYWGPMPWSPIVGVARADGVDWYRHEDGSFSTTQMVWRSDLQRRVPMTRVAHPGPAPAAVPRRP